MWTFIFQGCDATLVVTFSVGSETVEALLNRFTALGWIYFNDWRESKESDEMFMYQIKPVTESGVHIDLPTCMYTLPNVHAQRESQHELQVTTRNRKTISLVVVYYYYHHRVNACTVARARARALVCMAARAY